MLDEKQLFSFGNLSAKFNKRDGNWRGVQRSWENSLSLSCWKSFRFCWNKDKELYTGKMSSEIYLNLS